MAVPATVIVLEVDPRAMAPSGLRELRRVLYQFRGKDLRLEVRVSGRLVTMPDHYRDVPQLRARLSDWGTLR